MFIKQVNPGAQLCSGNPSYECKYQVERINTFAQSNNTAFPMIDHDPVNTGSSGSQSYSMGAETGTGGFTASASYSFSINWTSLTLTDNSNSYGYWTWTISNPLQSQVVTVDSGAVFVGPNTTDYIYASTTVNSSFDSWNTTPVTGLAQKSRVVSW